MVISANVTKYLNSGKKSLITSIKFWEMNLSFTSNIIDILMNVQQRTLLYGTENCVTLNSWKARYMIKNDVSMCCWMLDYDFFHDTKDMQVRKSPIQGIEMEYFTFTSTFLPGVFIPKRSTRLTFDFPKNLVTRLEINFLQIRRAYECPCVMCVRNK